MKRLLVVALCVVLLSTIAIYIFIPASLKIISINVVHTNSEAIFRQISEPANWAKWASKPNDPSNGTTVNAPWFTYNNDTFNITEILHNAARIKITSNGIETNSLFTILPVTKDSSAFKWESDLPTGYNPFVKVQRYRQAVQIKKNMSAIMDNLQHFVENDENVYGYRFHVVSTDDTILVAMKVPHPSYPQTQDIYKCVDKLQNYVSAKGARQTTPPMMNITRQADDTYQLMVALPIDKKIPVEAPYLQRNLVKGNFLITKVTGGEGSINHALNMMRYYISDYGKTIMAIPFQVLETDRIRQPDSAKWVTRIYYPVIQ